MAADLKAAMKEKNTIKKDTVQIVRAAVLQKEKDGKLVLDDDGVIEVIAKEVKSRKDVLPDYEKSGRDDMIAKINQEIAILLDYLPEQHSEEELRSIVKDAITETGASSMTDMGKIMAVVMPKIKGKADGKAVNALVRELLK